MRIAYVDLVSTEPPQYELNPRPRLHPIRAAWAVEEEDGTIVCAHAKIINVPSAFVIDALWCDRYLVDHAAREIAQQQRGADGFVVAGEMLNDCFREAICIGHSWAFHLRVIEGMFADAGRNDLLLGQVPQCTMALSRRAGVDARTSGGKSKSPSLLEAYRHFSRQDQIPPGRAGVHSGEMQLNALRTVWWGLGGRGVPEPIVFSEAT